MAQPSLAHARPRAEGAGSTAVAAALARPAALALGLASAAALAVLVRLPFLGLPLTQDEGGYGHVARLWARGEELYEGAWVDRPQGLMLVFRGLLHVDGGSVEAMRVTAALAGALLAVLVGLVALRLHGRMAAVAAALLVATLGASPFLEAFTLSGELLAAVPAAAAVLAFARFLDGRRARWLVAAGLLAGSAVMVKQSALDAGVAVVLFLVWRERFAAWRPLAVFGVSAAAPVLAAAAFAPDLGRWWYAVVAYRGDGDSLLTGGLEFRLQMLALTLPALAKGLTALALLAALGWRSGPLLVRLWLAGGVVGVLGGGNFHQHYYLQLVPPLAVLAGCFLAAVAAEPRRLRPLALGLAGAALALTVPPAISVSAVERDEQVRRIFGSGRLVANERAAAYVARNTEPHEPVLAIAAAPSLHYVADRPSPSRYLWRANLSGVPGALEDVRASVEARRPALVLEFAPPAALDPTGRLGAALRRSYRAVGTVAGARVLVPARAGAPRGLHR